jgi:hypothetical protein
MQAGAHVVLNLAYLGLIYLNWQKHAATIIVRTLSQKINAT